jgi:hypothetical protein
MIVFSILDFLFLIKIIIKKLKDEVKYIPSWFVQWWVLFGIETNIMPSLFSDKFQSYANNIHSPIFAKFHRLLYYIVHYNIPWIMGSNCEISVGTSIKYITRKISIRWWEKFTYEPILQKIQQEFELGDKN